ncbi:hypothetical protein [Brucella anthropi]
MAKEKLQWTAETNGNYDPPFVIRYDLTPGGKKNDDGSTSFSMTFPVLQVTDWVSDGESACKEVASKLNAFDVLVEALETLRSDCQSPIDFYERNGPEFTSPQGNEYESTSHVMAKFAELVASIDAALARAGGAS